MQNLAPFAQIRQITTGQGAGHIIILHSLVLNNRLARHAIGARTRPCKSHHNMIHAGMGHFLRGLDSGADGAFGFLNRVDLAKTHTARARCAHANHPKGRLPRKGRLAICGIGHARLIKPQNEAGDFVTAHIQNRHDTALERLLAFGAHCALHMIQIVHHPCRSPLTTN